MPTPFQVARARDRLRGEKVYTPSEKLGRYLRSLGPAGVAELSDLLGIDRRIGNRALRGRKVNASAFVQFSLAIGFDPYTGGMRHIREQKRCGSILWWFLGAAVNLQRIGDELSQRDAAKQAGVHYTTICRVENAEPVSAENYLAICKWLGAPIDRFTCDSKCNKREAA